MKLFDKNFYKKPHFYLSILAFALGLVFVILYSANGATQYNQEKIAPIIIVMGIIGFENTSSRTSTCFTSAIIIIV